MKLTKIHKVLKFKEFDWLRIIDFNTKKRKNAVNSLKKKQFFKLIINIVYGKTMENLRK